MADGNVFRSFRGDRERELWKADRNHELSQPVDLRRSAITLG